MDYIVIVVMPIKCFFYEIPEQRRLVQVPQLEGGEKKNSKQQMKKITIGVLYLLKGIY